MKSDRLLREYIRRVLAEDEGGGGGDYGYGGLALSDAGMGPYGMHYGSGGDMYNIFIKPFTDVVNTAAGKTMELSQKAQTLTRVAFETVMTTLIPTLTDNYSDIFKNEKQQIDKIRQEYGEIYQSNWDALTDNDVVAAAFMYSPAAVLTAKFAQAAPQVAMKLTSILTGGSIDSWLGSVKDKFNISDKPSKKSKSSSKHDRVGSGNANYMYDSSSHSSQGGDSTHESVLREDDEKKKKEAPSIGEILTNKKVLDKIANSKMTKKLEQVGQALVKETLGTIYKQAFGILSAKSLQDLQSKTGVKLKGMEKLQQVPEQERKGVEQTLLTNAKKSMKEFYCKNLEGQVQEAIKAGIPESHPYVEVYRGVISKIKAL